MSDSNDSLHLAIALDGAGWHPAAWREPAARPGELFTPKYWVDLVQQAERGLVDFVTIEDGLRFQSDHPLQPDDRTDRVRGRLDATLIAARVAPLTSHIGLVPTAIANHTEPFHLSKAIATIDYASGGRAGGGRAGGGRAGIRVQLDGTAEAAAHFGRREIQPLRREDYASINAPELQERLRDAFDEAAEYVEVLRRLWDSWEDDAEIRDVATGRFIDRDKLHHIDFQGRWFSVKGPSITPRSPQGQPVVAALGHATVAYQLIARSTDVGFVTPHSAADATAIIAEIRDQQQAAGRSADTVRVFADLVVFLDSEHDTAVARKQRLDERAGAEYTSDAEIFAGTPAELADLLLDWRPAGLSGYRLRPGAVAHDLAQITGHLVPELQRCAAFRTAYEANSLRGLLGLSRPANRYAAAGAA
jgi:alkanesulfonate monooxygenase SsuD/methylene tetrahydromethanopterin reductase-like flavin-dependent oxidoreductase (luciferase family)